MAHASAARTHRDPAKRSAVLAVAWESFLRDGYGGASMSDIAERHGGSKSTIYNYFRSKQEIFIEVVQQKIEELYAGLERQPAQTGLFRDDLRDFGVRLLEIVLSPEYLALQRLIIAESARFPILGTADCERHRGQVLAPLAARIEQEMKSGALRSADPMEAAEVLWNLCAATAQRRALVGIGSNLTTESARKIADRAVTIFLAAYSLPGRS